MRLLRAAFWSILAFAFVLCGRVSPAGAHGAVGVEQDVCVLKIGPDFMYFSGYQPALSQRKFCEDVPATGETIFVLDYAQTELREMQTDFRIVRETAEAEEATDLASITVAYLSPQVYPSGTLHFEHIFAESGNYVGIVTVAGAHGEHWVSRFPFSVGKIFARRTPYYLLAAAAALALLLIFWRREARSRRSRA